MNKLIFFELFDFAPGFSIKEVIMKCPDWKFVGGEGIESIAYDQLKEILFLKFWNNDNPYRYQNVTEEMYNVLMDQEHKTTFFNQIMRPVYKNYKKMPTRYFEDCK